MRIRALRGDRLRQLRESHDFSQHQLGRLIGTGVNQINRYEQGVADPSPYQLKRIAQELQCTTDYLLGLVDSPHDRLQEQALTADERRFLKALREGKLRTLLRMLDEAIPDEQEQPEVTRANVTAD